MPKENASYKRLSLIMLGTVIRINKKYYPQTLLGECKYEIKRNKMENLVNDDLDCDNDESNDYDESDNESENKADNESIE